MRAFNKWIIEWSPTCKRAASPHSSAEPAEVYPPSSQFDYGGLPCLAFIHVQAHDFLHRQAKGKDGIEPIIMSMSKHILYSVMCFGSILSSNCGVYHIDLPGVSDHFRNQT